MNNYPNLEIREFSQSIINFCNSSSLSDEVKFLVIKDILGQLERAANSSITREIVAREAEEKEKTQLESKPNTPEPESGDGT